MNKNLSSKTFWDSYWENEKKTVEPTNYLFNDLFKKFLPFGGTYLEIGCTPGTTMVNFHKTFGYLVTGLDYSQTEVVRHTLEQYGVTDGEVIEADFTTTSVFRQFDVVTSFGFVEHFKNYAEIVCKQAEFVKPGGYLVVEVPNLRYINWLMYRIFDRDLLDIHNLDIMNPYVLSRPILNTGNFAIQFCNYYFTNLLFFDANNPVITKHSIIRKSVFALRQVMKALRIDNIPNRLFSPYIIMIAQKI